MTFKRPSNSLRIGDLVRIFQRGRAWYANYQLDGRQHRPSLGTKVKKEAIARAEKLERDLQVGKTPRKTLRVSMERVCEEFLSDHEAKERRKGTISHYTTYVTLFREFMAARGQLWVSQIDYECVDLFRAAQRGTGSSITIYHRLCAVRGLVLFAVRRRYLESDPLPGFRNPKPKATKQQPCWVWSQVEQILAHLRKDYRDLFATLAHTGMRIGEALHLQPTDIDLANRVILIRPKDGWKPKTGEERVIPLCADLVPLFESIDRGAPWVFISPTPQGRQRQLKVSPRRSIAELQRVLKQLGLVGRHHTFRHSFVSHALISGIPEALVRKWVGHVDAAIIRRYTHVADQISQSQMSALFPERTVDGQA